MRCLNRNKTTVNYKTYVGKTDVLDENGLRTGEKAITYSDKKQ